MIRTCSDCLIIGYDHIIDDYRRQDDIATLTVARATGSKIELVNVFRGKEAENLYKKIINYK